MRGGYGKITPFFVTLGGPNKATVLPIDDLPEAEIDLNTYEKESRDLLIYDIPRRWSDDKILATFKNLGLVRKISIKSQHK